MFGSQNLVNWIFYKFIRIYGNHFHRWILLLHTSTNHAFPDSLLQNATGSHLLQAFSLILSYNIRRSEYTHNRNVLYTLLYTRLRRQELYRNLLIFCIVHAYPTRTTVYHHYSVSTTRTTCTTLI